MLVEARLVGTGLRRVVAPPVALRALAAGRTQVVSSSALTPLANFRKAFRTSSHWNIGLRWARPATVSNTLVSMGCGPVRFGADHWGGHSGSVSSGAR